MSNAAQDLYMKRRSQLDRLGPQWQEQLAYGDPTIGWAGDRNLVLYREVLTDEMTVYYELPNAKPVLVMKVPAEGFDIKKALISLRDADGRRHSVDDQIKKVDNHNDAVRAEQEYQVDQAKQAAQEKLHFAFRKDTGHHIAPITVSKPVHK